MNFPLYLPRFWNGNPQIRITKHLLLIGGKTTRALFDVNILLFMCSRDFLEKNKERGRSAAPGLTCHLSKG